MKYFYTFVTETLTRPVVVKAENQEEAEQKVIDAYYNGKFVLDAADFVDVNFETRARKWRIKSSITTTLKPSISSKT